MVMKRGSLLKNCPPFVTWVNVGTAHENDENSRKSHSSLGPSCTSTLEAAAAARKSFAEAPEFNLLPANSDSRTSRK